MADQQKFPGSVQFDGALTAKGAITSSGANSYSGKQHITEATDVSTSTTAGALKVAGGVAVAKNIECGGDINLTPGRRFWSSSWYGMTLVAKNDTECDAGLTFADNQLIEGAWDGGAHCNVTLPAATKGVLCVFRIVAQADGGNNLIFTAAGSDKFAAQTLMLPTINFGDGVLGERVTPQTTAGTAFAGGTNFTANGSSNNVLTVAAAGTNNQTNAGAEIALYCAEAGKWLVSFRGSELGSGASAGVLAFSG